MQREVEMREIRSVPSLDDREWSAVAYALDDAYRNGRPPAAVKDRAGLVGRIASALAARKSFMEPSDPRTGAVRRFVWACLHRSPEAAVLMPVLQTLGFSAPQIDALALLSH
jgi:hypothetical protein